MKLKDKVALVTGGSRGIGAAIAKRLAREGASVAVVYQSNRNAAETVAAEVRAAGGTAAIFPADVSDEAAVKTMVAQVVTRFGKIDILVNNAGIFGGAAVGSLTRELFESQFNVNTWSMIAVTQAVLPHIPSAGGRIINLSTNLVHQPHYGTALYAASKAAVEVLTKGFAAELGARHITVNAVAPTVTKTDMTAFMSADDLASIAATTPLGRVGLPEDIADVVAFFASDDSRWITGRTLLADGGRT
jgi:3-oxoacyl-[acyl-carrier protein] reductase